VAIQSYKGMLDIWQSSPAKNLSHTISTWTL